MTETMSKREKYIERLRTFADLLDAEPELEVPYNFGETGIDFFPGDVEGTALIAKIMPTSWKKNDPNNGSYNETYYKLTGSWMGAEVIIVINREGVCERKQVGTEKVVHAYVKAVSEYTEERPVYEYECTSLLAKAVA